MKHRLPELLIILLLGLVHFSAVSLPPADQDVGGITYNAMLINQGGVPYRDSFEQKLPGSFFIVAGVISLFGPSVYGLNTGAFLWNGLHLLALIWGIRRLWGAAPSRWAALAFVLALASDVVDGICPNYELWMNPLLTAGILLLIVKNGNGGRRLILAGALVTGGVLVKQQGAFSALVVLGWLAFEISTKPRRGLRNLGYLAGGALITAAPLVLYFIWKGELQTFLTMVNPKGAIAYASGGGGASSTVWRIARQETMRVFHDMPLLFYAGTSLVFYLAFRAIGRKPAQRTLWLLLIWILGASLGVIAGMRFYTHYYLQLIPPLAVAAGWLVHRLRSQSNGSGYRLAAGGLLAAILLWPSFGQFVHDLRLAWWQGKAAVLPLEAPTADEQRMAEQIRAATEPHDGLVVWGHAEGMYFLAQRLAPTRYYKYWAFMRPPALTYGPPELNQRAEEHSSRFLREIMADPPGAVVISASRHDAPVGVFPAFRTWLSANYQMQDAFDQKELWVRRSLHASEDELFTLEP